jgi:hypothetical protein
MSVSIVGACSMIVGWASNAAAAPAVPSGPHPRLFMSAANLAAYTANAATTGTAAAGLLYQCEDTFNEPNQYAVRGGADGYYWPESAVACAFAYKATGQSKYLAQAIVYWNAALNDDQTIGDGLGCVQGVSTNWQTWAAGSQSDPAPPIILTITHDTGYGIRWYGPDLALAYDWLNSAPGVSSDLLQQTQVCLTNWLDYYTAWGYHNTQAGANYNAGYVVAKAFTAIALGTDNGADGHLWTQVLDNDIANVVVGAGLAGSSGAAGSAVGPLVGGDWGEGWEYGPLGVLHYAAATAALEQAGASIPAMDAWTNSLVLRNLYATTPSWTGAYCGDGDLSTTTPDNPPSGAEVDAVLIGPSSDQAAAWALSLKQTTNAGVTGSSAWVYDAIAETRAVTPVDYTAQSPAPPLWYLARGTRELYARTAWKDPTAFWGVFMSSPQLNSDHEHFAASNFVFSRGADDLIVDPTPYGGYATWETNAVTADSVAVAAIPNHTFAPGQTLWSNASLPWARGTSDATYATRSDFAQAFNLESGTSDIPYAHREWVMLPEGEVVAIDRVDTGSASLNMYVTLHTNTGGGGLASTNGLYLGTIGSSQVAIHPVVLSGATPTVTQPPVGACTMACEYPCAACDTGRFAADAYRVAVPGPFAVAIHVVDGLAASEAPATVASINDSSVDPNAQNGGVIGASVYRASKQSYVVASSARDGVSPATMTYGVPGASAGRHIVYDAPEASDGTSAVTASVQSGRCVLSIAAGSGGGLTGHPLMFQVATASAGCTVTDSTAVPPGTPPTGGGIDGGISAADGGSSGVSGGQPPSGGPSGSDDGGAASLESDDGSGSGSTGNGFANGGGNAGGCAVGASPVPSSGWAFSVALALGGIVPLVRRRRRVGERAKAS